MINLRVLALSFCLKVAGRHTTRQNPGLTQKYPEFLKCQEIKVVYNHWTGLVDWTGGLDWWTDIFCAKNHYCAFY